MVHISLRVKEGGTGHHHQGWQRKLWDWTWLWHSTSWACPPISCPPETPGIERTLPPPREEQFWLTEAKAVRLQDMLTSCQPSLCPGDLTGSLQDSTTKRKALRSM